MRVYLVRHGETDWNAGGRWQGREDVPLNAIGIAQAKQLAERFSNRSVSKIYTSPLSRARETARHIHAVTLAPIVNDSSLIEMDAGDFEGVHYDRLVSDPRFVKWEKGETRCPGGESKRDVRDRALPAIVKMAGSEIDDFAVVAHSIVIRCVINDTLGLPIGERLKYMVENGSVSVLRYIRGEARFVLQTLNEKPVI